MKIMLKHINFMILFLNIKKSLVYSYKVTKTNNSNSENLGVLSFVLDLQMRWMEFLII